MALIAEYPPCGTAPRVITGRDGDDAIRLADPSVTGVPGKGLTFCQTGFPPGSGRVRSRFVAVHAGALEPGRARTNPVRRASEPGC